MNSEGINQSTKFGLCLSDRAWLFEKASSVSWLIYICCFPKRVLNHNQASRYRNLVADPGVIWLFLWDFSFGVDFLQSSHIIDTLKFP